MKVEQCKTCPWKKGTKCKNIPNYNLEYHQSLANTIAGDDGNLSKVNEPLKAMACHYSTDKKKFVLCWLATQSTWSW